MRRSSVFVVSLVVIVATAIWWLLVIGGADERRTEAEAQTETLELQRQQLAVRVAALQEADESTPEYIRAMREIEAAVPTTPEIDAFIETLNTAAEKTGTTIVAIALREPRADLEAATPDVLIIDLDLAVEAGFFEMLAFLIELEDMERLVVIDAMSVTPAGDAGEDSLEQDLLSVNLTGSLYTQTSSLVIQPAEGDG